ncbi:GNAT family N-acetyltransferase [Streptomyces sp. NBC_01264]|uniref:GNAT family N-acetyltransferase n=1 Tax=Streptomyces sp. NBC_01264 TaxID=2903804 RepID=UPI002257AD2A|nr:GNAT family N-acetyltransferase [Streptomyces sp. NBC_01264]MCX4782300.1 GNAT family N-acetyltransferase [Streptomyces sp. NBC_01264]
MTKTVTYVAMTDPGQLVPGVPVPELALAAVGADLSLVPGLMARIGAPYQWRSARRSPQEWQAWFTERPDRTCWLLTLADEPAGMVCYDLHPGADVEIRSFGLLPEFTGKGLGGHALTLAIRQGWNLVPGVRRVWLHTSSADSPNALPNYHRRGFRTFKAEEDTSDSDTP